MVTTTSQLVKWLRMMGYDTVFLTVLMIPIWLPGPG